MSTPETRPFITLPADQPDYETLIELTLAQRADLPGRFHTPVWLDAVPGAFVCTVCWDEGEVTGWPCKPAIGAGRHLFGDPREPAPVAPATEDPAPTQQWAVRHPDVSLSVHRSPHSVLYTASKLPGGTIVTRASDQAEWQVETNCLCGDSKPADRHFQACPGEDPAPHEPRVWATAADVPQGEPNLTICDAAGDVAARQSAGKWAWTVLGDLVITSQPTPCSWPMRDMQFPVTEVLSGVPTPGGTR